MSLILLSLDSSAVLESRNQFVDAPSHQHGVLRPQRHRLPVSAAFASRTWQTLRGQVFQRGVCFGHGAFQGNPAQIIIRRTLLLRAARQLVAYAQWIRRASGF
jgi:hypothetical protein